MRILRLNSSMIICMMLVVFSVSGYAAKVKTRTIELQCGKNFLEAQKFYQEGDPNVQLSVQTIGVKEKGVKGTINVIERPEFKLDKYWMERGSELPVQIAAECKPSGQRKTISLTDSYIDCEKGEGIKLSMHKPNSEDPKKFRAIVQLTETIDGKKKGKAPKKEEPKKPMSKLEWWEKEGEKQMIKELQKHGLTKDEAKIRASHTKARLLLEELDRNKEELRIKKAEFQELQNNILGYQDDGLENTELRMPSIITVDIPMPEPEIPDPRFGMDPFGGDSGI